MIHLALPDLASGRSRAAFRTGRLPRPVLIAGLSLLALAAVLAGPGAPRAAAAPVTVSLTFDNGEGNQMLARPMLQQNGMHATFYVNSGNIGDTPGPQDKITWAQLNQLYADGNEIGGHTLHHIDPRLQTPDQIHEAICQDRTNLLQRGYAARSFAHPFGYSVISRAIVQGCGYNSGRSVNGIKNLSCGNCPVGENIPPRNPFAILTPPLVRNTTTLAALKKSVTEAEVGGGGWVVFIFTEVCDGCVEFSISPSILSQFLSWLGPRAGQGTVVKTVSDVVGGSVQPAPDNSVPGLGLDTRRPIISRLTIRPKRFAVGGASTPIIARRTPRGTTIRYILSEPGTVTARIQRVRRGARSAIRVRTLGTLRRTVRGVSGRIRFSGRIGTRALKRGKYRVLLQSRDAAGNRSRSRSVHFKVVRG
jgi:hypothetical protein